MKLYVLTLNPFCGSIFELTKNVQCRSLIAALLLSERSKIEVVSLGILSTFFRKEGKIEEKKAMAQVRLDEIL